MLPEPSHPQGIVLELQIMDSKTSEVARGADIHLVNQAFCLHYISLVFSRPLEISFNLDDFLRKLFGEVQGNHMEGGGQGADHRFPQS